MRLTDNDTNSLPFPSLPSPSLPKLDTYVVLARAGTISQFAKDVIQLSVTGLLRLQGGITIFNEGYDYGSFGFGSYLQAVRSAETALGAQSSVAQALAPNHPELRRNRLYNVGATGQVGCCTKYTSFFLSFFSCVLSLVLSLRRHQICVDKRHRVSCLPACLPGCLLGCLLACVHCLIRNNPYLQDCCLTLLLVPSCPVLSCPVLSCPVASCPVLLRRVRACVGVQLGGL